MSQCLAIANEVGDRAGEGRAYGNLGIAYQSKGDFSKDIQYHAQDLAIAKEVGDRAEEGAAYANLGIAYKLQGDFSKAIEYHTQRLAGAKEVGDRAGEGRAYGIMQRRWATAYGIIAKEVGDRASGRGGQGVRDHSGDAGNRVPEAGRHSSLAPATAGFHSNVCVRARGERGGIGPGCVAPVSD